MFSRIVYGTPRSLLKPWSYGIVANARVMFWMVRVGSGGRAEIRVHKFTSIWRDPTLKNCNKDVAQILNNFLAYV